MREYRTALFLYSESPCASSPVTLLLCYHITSPPCPTETPTRPSEIILSPTLFAHASTLCTCYPLPAEHEPRAQLLPTPPLDSSIISTGEVQPSLPPHVLVATCGPQLSPGIPLGRYPAYQPPPGPGFLEELTDPSLISSELVIIGEQESKVKEDLSRSPGQLYSLHFRP